MNKVSKNSIPGKLISTLMLAFILLGNSINLNAEQALYDENSYPIESTSEICANKEYTLVNSEEIEYQYIYVLDQNNQLQESIMNNGMESKIVFPLGIENVKLGIVDYVDSIPKPETMQIINLKVVDCQSEEIREKYENTPFKSEISLKDESISFSKPSSDEYTNYNLKFQKLDGIQAKNYNFDEKESIEFKENEILQLIETYTIDDKEYSKKYEAKAINGSYYIREVKNFEVKSIEFNKYFKKKQLIMLVILIVVFIWLSYKKSKYVRAQKKENKIKMKTEDRKSKKLGVEVKSKKRRRSKYKNG